jgi:hypothetical protein
MSELIKDYESITGLKTVIKPVNDNVLVMINFKNLRTLALISENAGSQEIDSVILLGYGRDKFPIPLGSKLILKSSFVFSEIPGHIVRDIGNNKGLHSIVTMIKGLSKPEYAEFIKNNESVSFTEFLLIPDYHIAGYFE